MKRIICVLLSVVMIFSLCVTAFATTEKSEEIKNSLGKYYKFTFGEEGDMFDYNSKLNQTVTYKNNTFYPFWSYTDKNATNSANYKTMTDSSGKNGVDVLELKLTDTAYFTPLTSEGKPFETQPGKTYVVKINAYMETEIAYSQAGILLAGANERCNAWYENYYNDNREVTTVGCEGEDSVEKIVYLSNSKVSNANQSVYAAGLTLNNGNSWAQGHKGIYTDTASVINKTKYLAVPSAEDNKGYAVYDAANDSYSFNVPLYKKSDMSPIDADGNGVQDTKKLNNYLSLRFSGGTYTDSATGTVYPFTYSIESIEIWENGYTPGVDMIVDGEVVKSVDGENRDNIPYFIPTAPEGKYFSGWYTDKECKNIVDTTQLLPPSVVKLYAGFKSYSNSFTMDMLNTNTLAGKLVYPTCITGDAKGEYLSHVDRMGWTFKKFTGDGAEFYVTQPWGGRGAMLLSDQNNEVYVAEENTSYKITIEYKVADIITAEEVGTLPDGSTYAGGYVSFNVGIGMRESARRDLQNIAFTYATSDKKYTEVTDWITEEYTIETGSFAGVMPVIGVNVYSATLPNRYDANGNKISSEPGDSQFGYNKLVVKSIKIEKNPEINFGGASVLTPEAEEVAESQAIRVYASYNSNADITERGFLIYKGDSQNLLTEYTEGVFKVSKTDNFDVCWNQTDTTTTFSYYVKDFDINDTRAFTVRAYIKTSDGKIYSTEQKTYSVEYIKRYNELTNNTYYFSDENVLEKVKIQGAYRKLDDGITFDWTANTAVVKAYCTGTVEFKLRIPRDVDKQSYTVYIDGQRVDKVFEPKLSDSAKNEYTVSVDISGIGVHTIEFIRRSEAANGTSDLLSVTMKGTLEKVEENELLIEFIGDSITCGTGNLDKNNTSAKYNDGSQTYAFFTAKKLGADYRMRSKSGAGFEYSSGGSHSDESSWDLMYPLQNTFRDKETAYVNNREADIVCIYLGTNDYWSGWQSATGKWMTGDADNAVAQMKEVIALVKQHNPNAKVVWINGGMTTSYQTISERTMAELGGAENGYYTVLLPNGNSGGAGHPTVAEHTQMGEALYSFLIENDLA